MGWLSIGLKVLPYIVEAVSWVEKFITARGKPKQDAAVEMIKKMLGLAEAGTNKDLLNDDEVEAATRKVIDAVVALQNLITKKKTSD
jgi:hypothetical protein|tara:strand:- start:5322 stop:5582 length:261 start_codon:yes stop_codon:yes gene_type:complete